MKTASTSMKAHLGGDVTKLCRLYKLTRKDDQVFTFTDHDKDIDTTSAQATVTSNGVGLNGITDGGYVYEAAIGFSPTAIENKSDLSADNQEANVFIDSDSIKATDLRFGVWDACDVEIRVVNWSDLTMGELKLRKGQLGNLTWKNGQLTCEVLGLTNLLQQNLGRSYGAPCDAELGDSRCQATVPVHHGKVASAVNSHQITIVHGTPNDLNLLTSYYDDGFVTFTSGVLSGLSNQVDHYDGTTGALTLKLQLLTAPAVNDTFTISPGCAHDPTDCRVKFGNFVNYQGFPTMPGQDQILQYPDATG